MGALTSMAAQQIAVLAYAERLRVAVEDGDDGRQEGNLVGFYGAPENLGGHWVVFVSGPPLCVDGVQAVFVIRKSDGEVVFQGQRSGG